MKNPSLLLALLLLLSSCSTDEAEIIGNWKSRPGGFSGSPRSAAVAFTIGNKVYIGTGYSSGSINLRTFYEYDPASDVWTQKADFAGVARHQAVSFSIANKGYVGTGIDEDNAYLKDFWEYEAEADRWTRKADLGNESIGNTARRDAIAFAIGGKGYVGTGYGTDPDDSRSNSNRGDMWEFDPSDASSGYDKNGSPLGAWTTKADYAGGKRYGAFVFVIAGKAYVGGGNSNGTYPEDCYEFDPSVGTAGKWTVKEVFDDKGRTGAVTFTINNKGYVVGGNGLIDCWEFDPAGDANGVWTQKHNFEGTARSGAIGFNLGDKGYLGLGSGGYDDLWLFDPKATYVTTDDDSW